MEHQPWRNRTFLELCITASVAAAGAAVAAAPESPPPTIAARQADVTDRLIVKYRTAGPPLKDAASVQQISGESLAALQRAGRQHGLAMKALHATGGGAHVISLGRRLAVEEIEAIAAQLQAGDPSIEYAEPDRLLQPALTPNDPRYAEQWHYHEATAGIRAPGAWDKSTGSGVRVAVIDTGYRPHADLAANILPGYDFISNVAVANDGNGRDSDARDPGDWALVGECGFGQPAQNRYSSWHGTHVAGTIAALSNNSSGVAGVAFNARIVPVRALGKCGGYMSDIADALIWSAGGPISGVPNNAYPARVINLSLSGGGACSATTQAAINSARSRGAVVVVAAGNANSIVLDYTPANCQGVVTVGAVNRYGGKAWYSNYGAAVDLAAPGGDTNLAGHGILSTLNAGTTTPGADIHAFFQGTSMAAPHVAGVAALMLSRKPSLTPDQVESLLKSTARPFPASCFTCGAGIVDATAAVNAAIGSGGTTINEIEPNGNMGSAQAIAASGTTVNGTMSSATDNDYYVVQLPAGRTLTSTLAPNATSDYELYVYNSAGTLLGKSEKSTGVVDSVAVTNPGPSTAARYVRIFYYKGGTGATNGKYTLKLNW
ncbi:MAG TPA: S8 family peptidase [Paucimonas sp.]|nr:S8 family peptidase [Paucimonas sp.]